jgi:gamma-glutamyltranspeptidase
VVTNLAHRLLHGGAIEDAVRSPRLHTDGYEPIEVTESMPVAIRTELEKIGHKLKVSATAGGSCNAAERRSNGEMTAASNHVASGMV